MKDNFDLYSWNKNRYLDTENKSKENKEKDFNLREWNKKRYLSELNITHEQDDPKMGAELESDDNVVGEGNGRRQATMKLDQLTFNVVKGMFGEIPMFGLGFPNADDSYRSIFDANDLEDWKARIRDRFGNVNIRIDTEADSKWEQVKILDDKFIDDKKSYTAGKAAWLDKERAAGRTSGLDEKLNEYSKYDNIASYDYKGYKDKHFDICPAAEGLRDRLLAGEFKDNKWATGTNFEKEVGEWLYRHDILFQIEKQVLRDKEGDQSDVEDAKKAVGRIVNLSRDLGIPAAEISYLKAHIQKIKDIVEYSSLTESIKETLRFIKENNPEFTNEEIKTELKEIKTLGEQLNETMCKRGQNYMAARKKAGEKSSAYLSGRAVKVCKGQIKGSDGKKKKSFESLNEVNNSDIVKALAKAVDMEPKDVVAKVKASKDEVNEIAVTTAITIAGLLPAAMELVGGAFNKAKNSFKLNEKERTEYLALQQFYKEAKDKEEKKRLKKEMEPYESKIGNWFKDAGHSLHKAYTAPIRGLLWMASKLAPKDSSLKDKEKREKIANVIYAAAMIGIAGYGVASHIGHLKGVSDVAITIADSIKGGKSIKDATLGGLELLGLL